MLLSSTGKESAKRPPTQSFTSCLKKGRQSELLKAARDAIWGYLLDGAVEAAREKQAARRILGAIDDVEHLPRRSIEGDGVVARR
jgi:hypothetical protein